MERTQTISEPIKIQCQCGMRMVLKKGTRVTMKAVALPNIWRIAMMDCPDCLTPIWGEGPWLEIPPGSVF